MDDIRDHIDLERYPIDRAGDTHDALLAQVRRDLAHDGCAILKGFLTPTGVQALLAEAEAVANLGH